MKITLKAIGKYFDEEKFIKRSTKKAWQDVAQAISPEFAKELSAYLDKFCMHEAGYQKGSYYPRLTQKAGDVSIADIMMGRYRKASAEKLKYAIEAGNVFEGAAVLDAGCATGLHSAFLATLVGNNGRVAGIDNVPGMIDLAKERAAKRKLANAEFQVANLDDLSCLQEHGFDTAICLDTLAEDVFYDDFQGGACFYETIRHRLGQLAKRVRKEGKLVLSLPLGPVTSYTGHVFKNQEERFSYMLEEAGLKEPKFLRNIRRFDDSSRACMFMSARA